MLETILRVLLKTKLIDIVIGNSPNDRFWIEEIKRELRPLEDQVQIVTGWDNGRYSWGHRRHN